MSRVRLVPIVVIVVIAFAVLFGGWQAYQRFGVVAPLTSELKKVSGVKTVTVDAGNPSVITVGLKKVTDLQTTYTQIASTVSGTLSGTTDLELQDARNSELTSAYESMQPVFIEGIAKGNYTEMITAVNEISKQLGITDRVTMDEHNIYIQLFKGTHYLYHVMPYSIHQGGAAS